MFCIGLFCALQLVVKSGEDKLASSHFTVTEGNQHCSERHPQGAEACCGSLQRRLGQNNTDCCSGRAYVGPLL